MLRISFLVQNVRDVTLYIIPHFLKRGGGQKGGSYESRKKRKFGKTSKYMSSANFFVKYIIDLLTMLMFGFENWIRQRVEPSQ